MMRLILVRHGETALNAEHRYQGQVDAGLNAVGREQAAQVAARLRHETIDAVIASDLRRAMQTAQAIAAPHDLAVQPEPRLREMAFGDWEGLTHDQIRSRWPDEIAAWFDDLLHVAPPGGETLQQVAGRVRAFWDELVPGENKKTVVLVSHGGALRVLLCLALDLEPQFYWRFNLDVASISQINVYDGRAILNRLNDTSHYAQRKLTE
jgi:alpha-ribazole phosphatase